MKELLLFSYSLLTYYCVNCHIETNILVKESFNPQQQPQISQKTVYDDFLKEVDMIADKSLLIKDILEDDSKVLMMNFPHQWGKTINLNMIKNFLRIQEEGDQFPNNSVSSSRYYRLFVDGELPHTTETKLKTPFLISKHKHIVDEHLGRWPVIYVNFAFDGRTYYDMKSDMVYAIQMAYDANSQAMSQFYRIVDDKTMDAENKEEALQYIRKFRQISFFESNHTLDDIKMSLNFLSEILYIHYRKKPFILIDDYLSPWDAVGALTVHMRAKERARIMDLYADVLRNTFKDNDYLEKGILNGVIPLTKELRAFCFDQLTECSQLTGKFAQYYGFNSMEVKKMTHLLNLPLKTEVALWYWYDGYRANFHDLQIYQPWSISQFLNKKKFANYWVNIEAVRIFISNFFKSFSFKKRFAALCNGSEVLIDPKMTHFTWTDYEAFTSAMDSVVSRIDFSLADKAFMLLHAFGFLALRANSTVSSNSKYRMKIPNSEIRFQMQNVLRVHDYDSQLPTGIVFKHHYVGSTPRIT